MLKTNRTTNEVVTSTEILYGEQLTLWDSLDETAAESTQGDEVAAKPAQVAPVTIPAKPLDDTYTLVVVITLSAVKPLAEKWEPP